MLLPPPLPPLPLALHRLAVREPLDRFDRAATPGVGSNTQMRRKYAQPNSPIFLSVG
jgi:hypothetical protein